MKAKKNQAAKPVKQAKVLKDIAPRGNPVGGTKNANGLNRLGPE